ncbi:hypothetical protein KR222_006951, partial [Zaprionus bogoriensis]
LKMQSIQFILMLLIIQFRGLDARVLTEEANLIRSTAIIQQLNLAYNTQLNIVVNLNDFQDSNAVNFNQLDTSLVQLQLPSSSFNNFRLLGIFSVKTIIIVHINTPPLDAAVADFLPYLLWKHHELHIVFITKEEPSAWLQELFSYSFREGFINVLLIHQGNQTLSLYSYNPYPVVQVQRLPQLQDYFNSRLQLRNFHHFPIRTVLFSHVPRIMQYVNRKGQYVRAGYMFKAFEEFVLHYNGTLKILPNLGLTFAQGMVIMKDKGFDFACYPLELSWNLSGTAPLYLLEGYVIAPFARPIPSYLYFARPFKWTLWLLVIGAVGYLTLVLYIVYIRNGTEMSIQLLRSCCYTLFLSQPLFCISSWQQFVVHWLLFLYGFVLTNIYLAMLSSMLTSGLFEPQLNTLEDLAHSPYDLMVDAYFAAAMIEFSSLPAAAKAHIKGMDGEVLDQARYSLNTSFMYYFYKDRMDAVLYQQHLLKVPLFKRIDAIVGAGIFSYPIPDGLPYLELLNVYLRRMFDCGILNKMMSDSWRDAIEGGALKLLRSEGVEHKPYNLEFYYIAFAIWAIALTAAVLSFLLEMLWWRV